MSEPLGRSDKIAVIIPSLNEVGNIQQAVQSARAGTPFRIIVADGGSKDSTVELARNSGAEVMISEPGRAGQMNRAAEAASADILVFLHADTILPHGWRAEVIQILNMPRTSAGAFRLAIDTETATGIDRKNLRIMEAGANLRSSLFGLPYGDQAIFVRNDVFQQTGGFPNVPFMEDFVFIRKIKKLGRVRLASSAVTTSDRRWLVRGPWKTFLWNQIMIFGWRLGLEYKTLLRIYRGSSSRPMTPATTLDSSSSR